MGNMKVNVTCCKYLITPVTKKGEMYWGRRTRGENICVEAAGNAGDYLRCALHPHDPKIETLF
jgi:hypothetical protein